MNIAFYAPLKAPDHRIPSGDRAVGRMFLAALRAGGHRVQLASRLRAFERVGDARKQAGIRARARGIAARLSARYRQCDAAVRPQLWFTYHLYHKAPDLIGPSVSRELGIPYVLAEASHAPKQAGGLWDAGYRSAMQALREAAMIISLNPVDEPCLRALLGRNARLERIAPFIDAQAIVRTTQPLSGLNPLHGRLGLDGTEPIIVCVAMMRGGDKLASFQSLARSLADLTERRWQLLVLGDGPARAEVEQAMRPLGRRVFFAGEVSPNTLPMWLAGCDVLAWPAVNEAWGMVFIEAAAAGLPAVAGDEGGVSTVVAHGRSGLLAAARDEREFTQALGELLDDESLRRRFGEAARAKALAEHDLVAASARLDCLLRSVVDERRC